MNEYVSSKPKHLVKLRDFCATSFQSVCSNVTLLVSCTVDGGKRKYWFIGLCSVLSLWLL